jgi:hypothetical protein
VHIAGDRHPDSPTYAMLEPLLDWGAFPEGALLTQRLHSNGTVDSDDRLARYGKTAGRYVPETDHTVAGPFWEFMNATGTIYQPTLQSDDIYIQGPLFPNPFFATGFPITEAYWIDVPVGGEWQDVLVQCFERRCLTFTPGNPDGWQVEAGNIGQHYYQWRYGETPHESPDPLLPPGIGLPEPRPPGCININTASAEELMKIIHIDAARAQDVIRARPLMYIDSLIFVPGIDMNHIDDIREQGLACA